MKKIYAALISGLFAVATLSSCEKEPEPIDVTKNAFLHERAWQMSDYRLTTNIDAEVPVWTDLFTMMDPCKKDDYFFFHTKNSGAVYDYFIKCATTDPDSEPFYFSITDNDQYITVYTNPEDMAGSIILQGKITTPHIDEFKVNHRYWNEATELTEEVEFTFNKIVPVDF